MEKTMLLLHRVVNLSLSLPLKKKRKKKKNQKKSRQMNHKQLVLEQLVQEQQLGK